MTGFPMLMLLPFMSVFSAWMLAFPPGNLQGGGGGGGKVFSFKAEDSWGDEDRGMFLVVAEVVGHRRVRAFPDPDERPPVDLEMTLRPLFTVAGKFDPSRFNDISVVMWTGWLELTEAAEEHFTVGSHVLALIWQSEPDADANQALPRFIFPGDPPFFAQIAFMPNRFPLLKIDSPMDPQVLVVMETLREARATTRPATDE